MLLECLTRASATAVEGQKAFGTGCKDSAESSQGVASGGRKICSGEGEERRAPNAGFYCEKKHGTLRRVRAEPMTPMLCLCFI